MKHRLSILLVVIVVLGALMRLYDLSRGDAISDEVLYGFRSIGYLDFDFAVAQPTTLQLIAPDTAELPLWTKLSFYDHPPLVFLVQHAFLKAIGANLWGLRLPSALFGIASLYFVYLITKRLFSDRAGLIAAALMATHVLMIYVSRTGIQESQVIFFILLSVYLFLKAQDKPHWYLGFGAVFGLALLSKYTAAYLVVPLMLWLLIFDRRVFRKKELYLGALLTLAIVSPVIIYNLMLLTTLGHLDFQLSYIFGQHVLYWQETPGKQIGSLADRFFGIFQNMWFFASPVSTLIFTGSFVLAFFRFRDPDRATRKNLALLLLIMGATFLLLLAIGPSPRFLSMLIPWLVILAGSTFAPMFVMKFRILAVGLLTLIIMWEGLFSVNSYILSRPFGREVVHYSRIHWDMHPWGFNALDRYLGTLFRGRYPEHTIGYSLPWLNEIKHQALIRGRERGGEPLNALFIYNDNMSGLASLWTLSRHALYGGWAILTLQNYTETLASKGDDFYQTQGFTETYFIQNENSMLLNAPERITDLGATFEASLRERSAPFDAVYADDGTVAFRVYHF